MVSKETFIKTMRRLEDINQKMDNVDDALRGLSPDFGGFYIPEVSEIAIDILSEVFNDEGEWLAYCAYERNWLKDFKLGDAEYSNGELIDLSTWDKVYDFLCANMKENQNDK